MTILRNTLALSAIGLLLGVAGHAEKATPINAIVCTGNDGSKLDENVYAYSFDAPATGVRYLTVYLGGSHFNAMLDEEFFGSGYAVCSLSGMNSTNLQNLTIQSVTSSGVGIDVDGGSLSEDGIAQQYTIVSMSATSLQIGSASVKVTAKASNLSPDEAKEFEAFRARGLSLPKR